MPDTPQQPEHYVDASKVAQHLGMTKRQVLNLARAGKLPAYPVTADLRYKTWRFRLSEVDAFMLGVGSHTRDNVPVLGKPSKATRKEQSNG